MLLASLYFSRVVHANYLILAAALLPAAALAAASRVRADSVVVPLMLLALAVEVVENGVFRATWEQAVAAGLPAKLEGMAAVLAPRAGPGLTDDPLGLLVGAVAAGLAILYLLAAVFDAPARLRVAAVLVSAVMVVALPTLVVVGIGKGDRARPEPGPVGGPARPRYAAPRGRARAAGRPGVEHELPARPRPRGSRSARRCPLAVPCPYGCCGRCGGTRGRSLFWRWW
jgi:hypothetical protein